MVTPDGVSVVVFGGRHKLSSDDPQVPNNGEVIYSRDNGKTWVKPAPGRGFKCDPKSYYPSACVLEDGSIFMVGQREGFKNKFGPHGARSDFGPVSHQETRGGRRRRTPAHWRTHLIRRRGRAGRFRMVRKRPARAVDESSVGPQSRLLRNNRCFLQKNASSPIRAQRAYRVAGVRTRLASRRSLALTLIAFRCRPCSSLYLKSEYETMNRSDPVTTTSVLLQLMTLFWAEPCPAWLRAMRSSSGLEPSDWSLHGAHQRKEHWSRSFRCPPKREHARLASHTRPQRCRCPRVRKMGRDAEGRNRLRPAPGVAVIRGARRGTSECVHLRQGARSQRCCPPSRVRMTHSSNSPSGILCIDCSPQP